MINYLKSSDIVTHVKREEVDTGDELYWIGQASRLIDAYCRRPLGIKLYSKNLYLSHNMGGLIKEIPIIQIVPQKTLTGFKVRSLQTNRRGGLIVSSTWWDVTIPSDQEDLINLATGKLELANLFINDYYRWFSEIPNFYYAPNYYTMKYEGVFEFAGGFFLDTKLTSAALSGATTIVVDSVIGIIENETVITLGDDVTEYLITDVVNKTLTLNTALSTGYSIKTQVTGLIDEEVKTACAMLIEDRLTYFPNAIRQVEKLDVLTTTLRRSTKNTISQEVMYLLKEYKIF